jgi:hypothetical protein
MIRKARETCPLAEDDKENCYSSNKPKRSKKFNEINVENNPFPRSSTFSLPLEAILAPIQPQLSTFDSMSSINSFCGPEKRASLNSSDISSASTCSLSSDASDQVMIEEGIIKLDMGNGVTKRYKKEKSFSTKQSIQISSCWRKNNSADKYKGDHISIYSCNLDEINCKVTAFHWEGTNTTRIVDRLRAAAKKKYNCRRLLWCIPTFRFK